MQMRNTVYKPHVGEPIFSINAFNICRFSHLHICTFRTEVQLLLSSLGALSTVLRTALCTVSHTCSIKRTANDVITYTRKVLYTTTANKHDAVFLQVVSFSRDVRVHLFLVCQTNTGNFTHCRVRLLRCGSVNTNANATTLRT